jgi:hypothetical protein
VATLGSLGPASANGSSRPSGVGNLVCGVAGLLSTVSDLDLYSCGEGVSAT